MKRTTTYSRTVSIQDFLETLERANLIPDRHSQGEAFLDQYFNIKVKNRVLTLSVGEGLTIDMPITIETVVDG